MVMLENRPGQLNLTFIIRKGISLYVIDMAERKEAELAPAILQEFTLICKSHHKQLPLEIVTSEHPVCGN